jgi:hypothetical protein
MIFQLQRAYHMYVPVACPVVLCYMALSLRALLLNNAIWIACPLNVCAAGKLSLGHAAII